MNTSERLRLAEAIAIMDTGKIKQGLTRLKRLLKRANDDAKDRETQKVLSGGLTLDDPPEVEPDGKSWRDK